MSTYCILYRHGHGKSVVYYDSPPQAYDWNYMYRRDGRIRPHFWADELPEDKRILLLEGVKNLDEEIHL